MNKKKLEKKFSRHIARILSRLEQPEEGVSDDARFYVKGEMWLLCRDLIEILELDEPEEV